MTAHVVGIVSRAQWEAVAPRSTAPFEAPIEGGTTHWEGPGMWGSLWELAHASCFEKVRGIQRYHMNHEYVDIAYNYIVCPHGYVFEGRGLLNRSGANGTGHTNRRRHAICQLRGVGDPFPTAMKNATEWTYAHISARSKNCHRDIVATQCPGDDGCAHTRTFVLGTGPLPPAPTSPLDWAAIRKYMIARARAEVAAGPLLRIGSTGSEVVWWQHALNLTTNARLAADGQFGELTDDATRDWQRFWKLDVDGIVGPQSRRTMVFNLAQL